MLHVIFVLLVLAGFFAKFLATWPVTYAERAAWGCWLAAAVLWAIPQFGAGG